jgi:AraC family transcriptional regulator, regulatory protein of adaptative response / methylated-DNA-[protein]-cysteine methyltransferase
MSARGTQCSYRRMRTGARWAGSSLRRPILLWRSHDTYLLPPSLSGAPCQAANVMFYPSAAAAELAGFRPCLRCRPEAAPFSPAWKGTRTTVERALRLIADGALDDGSVETLADRLGIGSRHLSRLLNAPRCKPGSGRPDDTRAEGEAVSGRDRSHHVGDRRARRLR